MWEHKVKQIIQNRKQEYKCNGMKKLSYARRYPDIEESVYLRSRRQHSKITGDKKKKENNMGDGVHNARQFNIMFQIIK
jgi:hypothetical protein